MYILEKLTDKLIKTQIIDEEEKELYIYGFKQGFILLINIITVIIIGLHFKMIWQSIVFMISYSLLRAYAGGYHTSTQLRCYLFSIIMIMSVLWGLSQIPRNGTICFVITMISGIIIFKFAPVEDQNKPLSQLEQTVFKERTNIILIILIGHIVLFWFIGLWEISTCISVAVFVISIMLVLGKIKNNISENNSSINDLD